ncbi:MAG: hypothetical protein PQJ60_09915 [Spirochaetales bacterium]|nr:hypothetical protein [Spirochaetales bacterium]
MKKIICLLVTMVFLYSCEMSVAGICENTIDSAEQSIEQSSVDFPLV